MNKQDLPNFMIIGAAKAGTTSLHHYLTQHPQVYMPKEKELQFFTDENLYTRGLDYYADTYFTNARRFPARGEATPFYFHRPRIVIPRLQQAFQEDALKFILLLRHPVKRAWSHYLHMVRLGLEKHDFKTALSLEQGRLAENPLSWFSYFSDGLYSQQLQPWLDAYPRECFLILTQDDLASDTHAVLTEVFQFLGIDQTVQIGDLSVKNEARVPFNKTLMKLLMGDFPGANLIKKAVSVPARRRLGMLLRHAATKQDTAQRTLPPAHHQELCRQYRAEIDRLELMLGRSFSTWRS